MGRTLWRAAAALLLLASVTAAAEKPPAVGDRAEDFSLPRMGGGKVELAELRKAGPVVLVVLRGYPGYQCPVCNAQVGDFLSKSEALAKAKAQVVFVYPGPAAKLPERAADFMKNRTLPATFHFALDPDMEFITANGLRWDKPNETAYPATFVIDSDGRIRFALVSQTHGGRAKAATVLDALAK